jgi:CheY-like chemotaxis protein
MCPTILVVDDNQLYRSSFCSLLQACWPDATVATAADGSEALALLPQRPWDAILLDYQLPTISGGDLVRRMRARAQASGMPLAPVVLMSSQPDVACFTRALGAVAFLPKPVALAELQAALAPYLPAPASGQNASPPPASAGTSSHPPTSPARMQARPQPDRAQGSGPQAAAPFSAVRRPHSAVSTTQSRYLQATILDLFYDTIRSYPPPHPPAMTARAADHTYRIGEYLVQLGYLTSRQLTHILHTTYQPTRRPLAPLGYTLVANDLVPSPVVIAVLLQQFHDRLVLDALNAPRFLGEQLLIQAQLTPAQLALALHEQIERYQHGRWTRLGAIIVRRGWLDPDMIRAAVNEQGQATRDVRERSLNGR